MQDVSRGTIEGRWKTRESPIVQLAASGRVVVPRGDSALYRFLPMGFVPRGTVSMNPPLYLIA